MTRLFDTITSAPTDPILGLNDAFKKDTNTNKINLGIGVCMDDNGHVPIMTAVKKAEQHILKTQNTKTYVSMLGSTDFNNVTNQLLYGNHLKQAHTTTAQMPAGSGALRVGFEFVKSCLGNIPIYVPNVTWGNHLGIIAKTGLSHQTYTYYDAESQSVDFDALKTELLAIKEPAAILLHVICHNPTGVDLSPSQWDELAILFQENPQLIPFLDCAYQGFATSLDEDIYAARRLSDANINFVFAYSFSKNMALYRERIGALSIYSKDESKSDAISTQIQSIVRGIYSSPPAHGAEIVTTILQSDDLKSEWMTELNSMRERVIGLRANLAARRQELSFLTKQNGLFSIIGLDKETITTLREDYGIYIVGNSRINIAGLSPSSLDYLCQSLDKVLQPA